jgi:hypothetical protein
MVIFQEAWCRKCGCVTWHMIDMGGARGSQRWAILAPLIRLRRRLIGPPECIPCRRRARGESLRGDEGGREPPR